VVCQLLNFILVYCQCLLNSVREPTGLGGAPGWDCGHSQYSNSAQKYCTASALHCSGGVLHVSLAALHASVLCVFC
jgi:hypothetical protein